jgi:hypothetical protein
MTILSAVVLALSLFTLAYLRLTAEPIEDEDDAKRTKAFREYLSGKQQSHM